jgi:L-malate glycosyltransferase
MNLHVLYFSERCTPHDERFLTALLDAGHHVTFAHLNHAEIPPYLSAKLDDVSDFGFRTDTDWISNTDLAKSKLTDLINRVSPDVINAGPITSCGYISAVSKVPVLLTSWGSDLLHEIKVDQSAHARATSALQSSQWLAVDTELGLNAAANLVGSLRDRSTVFPWGTDLDLFSSTVPNPDLRRELGWEDKFIVFSNRGWTPGYDIPTVLNGFELAAKRNDNLRLILANDGPLRNQIEQLIQELGIHELVALVGRISSTETANYLATSDLYVSASKSDGSSISLLEAMASGVPPIVTDFEANLEWITDEQTGFTFEIGNASALENVLTKAIHSPSLTTQISTNVRKLALQRADWEKNQIKYTDAVRAAAGISLS